MSGFMLRVYRGLLHFLPEEFRQTYGQDMVVAFEAILTRRGPRPWIFARGAVDIVMTSLRLRRARRLRPRPLRREGLHEALSCDAKLALRRLRRDPGACVASVLILALGIAATCTVFALVDSVLLRPLDYQSPERLVALFLHEISHGNERAPTSPANFLAWSEAATSLELMTAAHPWQPVLTGQDRPRQLAGLKASPSLFELLGVAPLMGSTFTSNLGAAGDSRVVVLGEGLWKREFGGDPEILGQRVTLGDEPYTVIAVMPQSFAFPPFWATEAEMWAPLILTEADASQHSRYLRVFARMRPGVALPAVKNETDVISARLVERFSEQNAGTAIQVESLREPVVGDVRRGLWVLLAAVVSVLLIAAVNASGLASVRALANLRDTAISAALGASPWRLMAPALLEGFLLCLAAGAAGLGGGHLGVTLIRRFGPKDLPRLSSLSITPAAVAVTVAICMLAGLGIGLWPALRARRLHARRNIRESVSPRHRRPLLSAQIAMSAMLLAGAGLLGGTYLTLARLEPGFLRSGVLTMTLVLPSALKDQIVGQKALLEQIASEVVALPGVERAGFVNHLPIGGDIWGVTFARTDLPEPSAGEEPRASLRVVTPTYFETLQIPLRRGRVFESLDESPDTRHVVVNEHLAETYWPSEDPVGRTIRAGGDPQSPPWTVIGVVGDVRQSDLTDPVRPELYFSYQNNPAPGYLMTSLAVRTSLPPDRVVASIRRVVSDTDDQVAVADVRTMDQILSENIWQQRFNSLVMTLFAAAALLLAAIGLYGVVSYTVRGRTREMAIRQALGARPRDLAIQVLTEGLRVTGWGVAFGLALAYVSAGALATLLYGIDPTDWRTYAGSAGLLTLVSLVACYLPARRAGRLDPVAGLRSE